MFAPRLYDSVSIIRKGESMPTLVRTAISQYAEVLAGQGLKQPYVDRILYTLQGRAGLLAACQKTKGPNVTMGQVDDHCVSVFFQSHTGGNGSRNNKLVHVRKFLVWAERKKMLRPGVCVEDILAGQHARKFQRAPKIYLEADEFEALLDRAEEHHIRDRALVAVILFTLARQSEVRLMKLSDLDLAKQTLQVYREKTSRWTEAGVTPELAEEMNYWLTWYADNTGYGTDVDRMVAEHPDWHLIPCGKTGRHWRDMNPERPVNAVQDIVQNVLAAMGYESLKNEGGHTVRRSGARQMFLHLRDDLGSDGALVMVQAMLDHDNVMVTLKYIGMDQEKDKLNNWLKTNSMYGTRPRPESNVLPFPQRDTAAAAAI
jgi:integrase